ncbi:uncharacterized protein BJ171DRAFT_629622 [Polychytrium aggregatum]|uniref:uncharacterized protein n=1 Tax=Polychytrium aggregatum TaxID=110093 RepID=UPI0022FDE100|nr:uncharacterized protein BJ171DRAFT_629622 [Polychytrium aggregatum]KAI9201828.1 hypothetical protein BJ171DRAFT_629622 [Polychytrium aggregatum]
MPDYSRYERPLRSSADVEQRQSGSNPGRRDQGPPPQGSEVGHITKPGPEHSTKTPEVLSHPKSSARDPAKPSIVSANIKLLVEISSSALFSTHAVVYIESFPVQSHEVSVGDTKARVFLGSLGELARRLPRHYQNHSVFIKHPLGEIELLGPLSKIVEQRTDLIQLQPIIHEADCFEASLCLASLVEPSLKLSGGLSSARGFTDDPHDEAHPSSVSRSQPPLDNGDKNERRKDRQKLA